MDKLLCSQIKGVPVVDRLSGRVLGSVVSVVGDVPGKRISGVVMEASGGLRRQYFLAKGDIYVISRQCVIAKEPRLQPVRGAPKALASYQLYSSQGQMCGTINDYLIDTYGGICGFEVCKSLYEDVKNGREIREFKGNLIIAQDRVQITQESAPEIY